MQPTNPTRDSNPKFLILPALPPDASAIIACGNAAFAASPLRAAIWPAAKAHLTPASEFQHWRIARKAGKLEGGNLLSFKAVLSEAPERLVGYAAWMAPGAFAEQGSIEPEGEQLPACMDGEVHRGFLAQLDRERERVWEGDSGFWYLAALGVDPEFQRQGVAAALLRWGLEQADAQGLPVYLEATPEGVALYHRFGFETVRVLETLENSFEVPIMIRQPQSKLPALEG